MTVYCIFYNMAYEGDDLIEIYTNLIDALAYAKAQADIEGWTSDNDGYNYYNNRGLRLSIETWETK